MQMRDVVAIWGGGGRMACGWRHTKPFLAPCAVLFMGFLRFSASYLYFWYLLFAFIFFLALPETTEIIFLDSSSYNVINMRWKDLLKIQDKQIMLGKVVWS